MRVTNESVIVKTYSSPFTLSLWFDKLTMISFYPFALSLSKGKLSMNGLFSVSNHY